MHVFILRWCPAFSDLNEPIVGQHELIERTIREKPIPIRGRRDGYSIPFASEFKLMEYRIKKEALIPFLEKLRVYNLVPKNRPRLWHVLFPKIFKYRSYTKDKNWTDSLGSKAFFAQYVIGKLSSMGLWLKSVDYKFNPDAKLYVESGWCYNFLLGVLDDYEVDVNAVEGGQKLPYESL